MQAETLDAQYGGQVEVDVCHHCNGLWFDGRESLQLAPGSTLKLFGAMYARREVARQPLAPDKRCPRCDGALGETYDMQRGTRFTYFRCQAHGRYTTFFQFLREKNLVRAPTPRQLAELKAPVKQVLCSNCGSPILLAEGAACSHCQAPVSILAEESINQTLNELQAKEVKRTTVDPTLAARLVMNQLEVNRTMRQLDDPVKFTWSANNASSGLTGDLLEVGAQVLVDLIAGLF